jgi:hypothetical protein
MIYFFYMATFYDIQIIIIIIGSSFSPFETEAVAYSIPIV